VSPTIKLSPRKKQIETEAALLFKERGYMASSMRELANMVGIEAGSLYSHFKSKESILQNICFRMAHSFFKELDSIESTLDSPDVQLKNAIKSHIKVLMIDPIETLVFQTEWKHLSEPHLADFINMRKDYEKRFQTIFQKGMNDKTFKPHDAHVFTLTLLSALNHAVQWYSKEKNQNSDAIAEKLISIFFNGILNK
jgi:AcrR family transcriptional regulator